LAPALAASSEAESDVHRDPLLTQESRRFQSLGYQRYLDDYVVGDLGQLARLSHDAFEIRGNHLGADRTLHL